MKIMYMGTPDFAVPALSALCESGYDVAYVVSNPDRPRDRGKTIQCCPVKSLSQSLGLPVGTPETLKSNDEFLDEVRALAPDVIIVAAYGKILPKELLDIPRLGCINIHASLLPLYRGAAPIHRAVIDECSKTGVTLMHMSEGMDAGDIISMRETEVGLKTTEQLFDELSRMGAELLLEELPNILAGTAQRIPQDHTKATYAPMVTKKEARIDFEKTANQICALVRGMYSWPCAWTQLEDVTIKVHEAVPSSINSEHKPGTVLRADAEGIVVACSGGSVALLKIQLPGKKAMDARTFLLGNKIEIGAVLR